MIIDHIGLTVGDYEKSKAFYLQALQPLGITLLMEVEGFAGFGLENAGGPIAEFWLHQGPAVTKPMHIAFSAENRQAVELFFAAALEAGGQDNGKPGLREIYHPHYYGAFILDPDGHNIEAVCHQPLP